MLARITTMSDIFGMVTTLESLDDLNSVHERVMQDQPCVILHQITYPQGNIGYFIAAAMDDKYMSVSIGKPMHDMLLAVVSSDRQPYLDS